MRDKDNQIMQQDRKCIDIFINLPFTKNCADLDTVHANASLFANFTVRWYYMKIMVLDIFKNTPSICKDGKK